MKIVTSVYGTSDQWGHWPVVWQSACMACAAFTHGRLAGTFGVDGKGINGRQGRAGTSFGVSNRVGGEPRAAGISPRIRTEVQQREGRVADAIRGARRGRPAKCLQGAGCGCLKEQ